MARYRWHIVQRLVEYDLTMRSYSTRRAGYIGLLSARNLALHQVDAAGVHRPVNV